jgi:hypothetical protein
MRKLPLGERVQSAPQELVDLINLDNAKNGWPCDTATYRIDDETKSNFSQAIKSLPSSVVSLVDSKVVGVFLVEKLGSTGYTDIVYDASGTPVSGFVVIDPTAIGPKKANEWMTWKEQTPFAADDSTKVLARIERKSQDNIPNALQFILLHEFGHAISIGEDFIPSWSQTSSNPKQENEFKFYKFSWASSDGKGKFRSNFDSSMTERVKITYYFGAKNRTSEVLKVYRDLEKTNFPTLYASTSPYDDFADSFAGYVHSVLMKKPYEILILKNGKEEFRLKSCWQEARCREKREFFDSLFSRLN